MVDATKIIADNELELFVKEVFVLEHQGGPENIKLPFFADGYPGIIYIQSEKGVLLPPKKALSSFFLYGQMIAPFELLISAPYLMIVFQLYPFAPKLLFDVDPNTLNDDCYDLPTMKWRGPENPLDVLIAASDISLQTEIIAKFLTELAVEKGMDEYREIQRAIQTILDHRGIITVNELAKRLNTTERTLRRKFNQYIGISPKKFAKIIQFQTSLGQIFTGDFSKLTDVVYENGYTDQSHFIRNIRKFTGKKPLQLKNQQ